MRGIAIGSNQRTAALRPLAPTRLATLASGHPLCNTTRKSAPARSVHHCVAMVASLALLGWLCVAAPASAAIVHASGPVTVLITYANFGNGDIMVRLTNAHPSCADGFWLTPSQPGFKSSLAFLLAARSSGESVLIGAEDTLIWSGSGGRHCRIDYVGTPY